MAKSQQYNSLIQQINLVRSKVEQGMRIRRILVMRKLKLFEEFDKLDQQQRLARLKEFLESYRSIYLRELTLVELFRRAVESAIKLVDKIEIPSPQFSATFTEFLRANKLLRYINSVLNGYKKRMNKEKLMLFKTPGEARQAELLQQLHQAFKLEVGGDLKLLAEFNRDLTVVKQLKAAINSELALLVEKRKRIMIPTVTAAAASIATGGSNTASENDTILFLYVLSTIVAFVGGVMLALTPRLVSKEQKLLAEFATFDALSKLSFR